MEIFIFYNTLNFIIMKTFRTFNLQTCKPAFKKLMSIMFGIFLFASCAKEPERNETVLKAVTDDQRSQKIIDFHSTMMSNLEIRSGSGGIPEYTPAEFIKNSEESLNYTYSVPFNKYWNFETTKDTISISITNCKILENEGSPKYQQILNKIICRYVCSDLPNKNLKFTKISILAETCTEIQVELITTLGTVDIVSLIAEPNPTDPQDLASHRRIFSSSMWALYGNCTVQNWGDPIASKALAEKATFNLIGGYDLAHTLIDIEKIYLNSYITPQTNWWSLNCYDPNWNQCGWTDHCNLYFGINPETGNINYNVLTQLGLDKYCLTDTELNSILVSTESYCASQAEIANKHFVNLSADWTFSLCGDTNEYWEGILTVGKKLYRTQTPVNLPTGTCDCI